MALARIFPERIKTFNRGLKSMMTRKTIIYLFAAVCLVANQAQAQVIVNQGAPVTTTNDGQQAVIINAQPQQQAVGRVSAQPATVVQAAPVGGESRAEQLRKARESAEIANEQRVVEKLEESRLQDEKARADRLFNNNQNVEAQPVQVQPVQVQQVQPAPQPVVQPVQVQQVQQAPAPVAAPAEASVKAEVVEAKIVEEEIKKDRMYLSGGIGTSQYYGVINVSSNAAAALAVGWQPGINERLNYEGTFMYSNYYINEYWKPPFMAFKEMAQYNFGGAIKYAFTTSAFRPYAGGLVNYTYRSYSNRGPCLCGNAPATLSSSAVDVGVLLGADYRLTRDFAVGLEYKYIMNLWAKSDDRYIKPEYLMNGTTPIENMNYYSVMLFGKYMF